MEKDLFVERYLKWGGKVVAITEKPCFRINTTLITPEQLLKRFDNEDIAVRKVPYLDHGYEVLTSSFSIGSTIEYLLGYYYIQSAIAQLPVLILQVNENDLVLDCCASPGGKTTQLAQYMNNNGQIIALEKKRERLSRLKNNLERCQIANTTVYHMDARKNHELGVCFDKILVDAPCSGNYVTDKHWFSKRTPEDFVRMATVQKAIIKSAIKSLRPGGTLVYSTCSLEPEENELVIDYALRHLPVTCKSTGLQLGTQGLQQPFERTLHPDIRHCRRFWPHQTTTQGFFIAKLVKK
ncbi:NOL1/NOP2/sun family putative RNA methylase [Candidatus Woesearchaeota archaeon]|nr:NOL1/NOP2/sun family putative RNA methylase [Candidatus Woesearchaeota archaeon]